MTIPSVKDFFAQYAEKGHIFPAPGLRVLTKDGIGLNVWGVAPNYSQENLVVMGQEGVKWNLLGWGNPDYYIAAILDKSGAVVAGDL